MFSIGWVDNERRKCLALNTRERAPIRRSSTLASECATMNRGDTVRAGDECCGPMNSTASDKCLHFLLQAQDSKVLSLRNRHFPVAR